MSIIAYTNQEEYDVVHESQDCRGWTVTDQAGNSIGKVSDLLVDTDRMRVDSVVIDGKARIPVEDITLRDKSVAVRGVYDDAAYANVSSGGYTTAENGDKTYGVLDDQSHHRGAGYVSGVTKTANDGDVTIPIIEEQFQVGKQTVESGGAHVRTTIEERPVEENVTLREENVTVERRPVDRPLDADTAAAFKEGSFEVTTQAEVPVVEKQARVVEEVVINKEVAEHTETVRDSVKRTDVKVDEFDEKDAAKRGNG